MNQSITSSTNVEILASIPPRPQSVPGRFFTRGLCESVQFRVPAVDHPVSMLISSGMEITPLPTEIVIPCEIDSFSPEPYKLNSPLRIVVVQKINGMDVQCVASHHLSNIHASGDTVTEAIDNLKSLILDIFEILASEPEEKMGIKAKHQLALLQSIIEPE